MIIVPRKHDSVISLENALGDALVHWFAYPRSRPVPIIIVDGLMQANLARVFWRARRLTPAKSDCAALCRGRDPVRTGCRSEGSRGHQSSGRRALVPTSTGLRLLRKRPSGRSSQYWKAALAIRTTERSRGRNRNRCCAFREWAHPLPLRLSRSQSAFRVFQARWVNAVPEGLRANRQGWAEAPGDSRRGYGVRHHFAHWGVGGPLARRVDRPEADVPRLPGPRQLPTPKASATMPHEWRGTGNGRRRRRPEGER